MSKKKTEFKQETKTEEIEQVEQEQKEEKRYLVLKNGEKHEIISQDGMYLYLKDGRTFCPNHPDILKIEVK